MLKRRWPLVLGLAAITAMLVHPLAYGANCSAKRLAPETQASHSQTTYACEHNDCKMACCGCEVNAPANEVPQPSPATAPSIGGSPLAFDLHAPFFAAAATPSVIRGLDLPATTIFSVSARLAGLCVWRT